MSKTKVWSDDFEEVIFTGNGLIGFYKGHYFKKEDLTDQIYLTQLVRDFTPPANRINASTQSTSIIGAILFGWVGALIGAYSEKVQKDMAVRVILNSGKVLTIRTNNEGLLSFLRRYSDEGRRDKAYSYK